ncbi:hypothetical protein [Nonomuraea soli]|uniref:tRNA nucleotidyltransferase (CCA-adding enzyme) n=1 Tax=Nonomuraea soli TaxID=1032476 RepID=A0A7W0HVR1_9ACTN|nr:hypothetical protein [Nonomuraea soli]MBA2897445.1 tRNA nucleotidyltransferase (CCA-adding enzyme) [Nonomuraea soli]
MDRRLIAQMRAERQARRAVDRALRHKRYFARRMQQARFWMYGILLGVFVVMMFLGMIGVIG